MTTETNAERLERVSNDVRKGWSEDENWGFDTEDMMFLVRQAERAQELEKALEGMGKAVEIYSEMPLNEALELLIKITQEDSK